MSQMYTVAEFAHVREDRPVVREWTTAQLIDRLTTFARSERKESVALWSPTEYGKELLRKADNVTAVNCLVLDFDGGHRPDDLLESWKRLGLLYVIHSTYRHAPKCPKWRAIFPLSAPVPASHWPHTWSKLAAAIGLGLADTACSDPCRMYYLPSAPSGGATLSVVHDGRCLNPDDYAIVLEVAE